MRAAAHPRQEERLNTLRRYNILDTPREDDFDEIVALASRICEAPISVINLIDESRQWFKAEVGLGVRETPLETSLCSHVILEGDFVEIQDTLSDPRMADNPLCLDEPGLRFYAGARLVAPDGMPIGTLCVLDNEPRSLNDLQRETLRVLSHQVMKQLELRRALANQEILRKEIDHRVKNSLQSVAAVVRIYGRTVEDAGAREVLDAVQRQIDAAAALHHELQGSPEGDDVTMDDYLPRIAGLLQDGAPSGITIDLFADPITLEPKKANAIGMIVSEFVANAIKHGFPDGRSGMITIALRREPEMERVTLECSDDGVGSAAARPPDARSAQGIGMSLVAAAASTLGATLTSGIRGDGAHLTLDFPVPVQG